MRSEDHFFIKEKRKIFDSMSCLECIESDSKNNFFIYKIKGSNHKIMILCDTPGNRFQNLRGRLVFLDGFMMTTGEMFWDGIPNSAKEELFFELGLFWPS